MLAVIGFPLLPPLVHLAGGPRPQQPFRVFLHDVWAELKTAGAQVLLQTMLLAYHAGEMVHAIVADAGAHGDHAAPAARVGDGRGHGGALRRAARAARPGSFVVEMWAGPAAALADAAGAVLSLRASALPVAPAVPGRLAGVAVGRVVAEPAGRAAAAGARRRRRRSSCASSRGAPGTTSSASSRPQDHWLPPDNVQAAPELRVAHRTSPTNIGMGLLSTLAAHDFGYLDDRAARRRASTARCTTVEAARAATRATCSTGTTRATWRRCCRATCRRWTAAIWRAP